MVAAGQVLAAAGASLVRCDEAALTLCTHQVMIRWAELVAWIEQKPSLFHAILAEHRHGPHTW